MADANLQVRITAEDAFSGVFGKFGDALSGVTSAATAPIRALGGIVDTVGKIGLAIGGVQAIAGAVKGAGEAFGLGLNKELEDVTAKMVAFTGSQEAATAVLAEVRAEANQTPFAFKEMADATAALIPAAKQAGIGVMDLVKQAEVLAALNPSEGLTGASFALREALSGDFVSIVERFNLPRERLKQLKDEGVPAMEAVRIALAEMGVDASLVAGMANTLGGRWSTFADTIDGVRMRASAPLFDKLKDGLSILSEIVNDNAEVFNEFADTIGSVVGDAAQEFLTFIVTVRNIARDHGLDVFSAAITALELRIGEVFGPGAQGVFHEFIGVVTMLRDIGTEAFERISGYVTTFAGIVQQALAGDVAGATNGLVSLLASAADDIVATLQDWGKAFINWIADTTQVLADGMGTDILDAVLGAIMEAVPVIAETIAGWVDSFVAWFPEAYARYIVALGGLVETILDWIAEKGPGFVTVFLTEWVPAFLSWVADVAVAIIPKMVELVANIVSWLITTGLPKFIAAVVAIGAAIGNGLVVAIEKMIPIIGDAFVRLAQGGLDAFKRVLGIASPSAVMQAMGEFVVEGFVAGVDGATEQATGAMTDLADAIGAVMPVILSASETEVNRYNAAIASALSAHARSVEDAERNHQQALADLQADYDAAKPADKAKVLQRIEDENLKHARRIEDLELASARKTEDIASQHGDTMAAISQREAENRFRALQDLRINIADVEGQTAASLEAVGERMGTRINEAIQAAASAIQDASQRAADQIATAEANLDLSRAIRGRREEFAAGQTAAADERRMAQELSDLARKRSIEDADAQARVAADLANAKTDKEREGIQSRFAAAQTDLMRRRQREDEDRAYARQRQAEDRAFRQQQQQAAQAFSDQLENEALARQIDRINLERDNRITGINDALVQKQALIAEDASREVEQITKSASERIAKLKSEFFDRVGPMTAEAKDAVNAYISDVMGRIGELQAKAVAAAASVASIGATSGGANAITAAANRIVLTTTASGADIARAQQRMGGEAYADGGMSVPGGFALVGERGPELVRLPGGADVIPSGQSMRMLGGGGDDNRPVVIQLDGQVIARSTWRHLKRLNATGGAVLGLS